MIAVDVTWIVGAAMTGGALGVMIMGILTGARQGAAPAPADERDTDLLNFLESSRYYLYFNSSVEDGLWGVLNEKNELRSTGRTVRDALDLARDKWINETLDGTMGSPVVREQPAPPAALDTLVCETCQGKGECMQMVCHGGPPVEENRPCPDCDGIGEIHFVNGRPL